MKNMSAAAGGLGFPGAAGWRCERGMLSSPSSTLPASPHDPQSPAHFKMLLQAGGRWITAALRRELSVPRDTDVPSPAAQPRGPGSNPAWCKPLIQITIVTPALGQSVFPGAEVPPQIFGRAARAWDSLYPSQGAGARQGGRS